MQRALIQNYTSHVIMYYDRTQHQTCTGLWDGSGEESKGQVIGRDEDIEKPR